MRDRTFALLGHVSHGFMAEEGTINVLFYTAKRLKEEETPVMENFLLSSFNQRIECHPEIGSFSPVKEFQNVIGEHVEILSHDSCLRPHTKRASNRGK